MLEEFFNNLENKTYLYLFMLASIGHETQRKYIIIYCSHRGSSYTQCPQMALVFGIEVSSDNMSRNFTSPSFLQVLSNVSITVSTRQNAERGEK